MSESTRPHSGPGAPVSAAAPADAATPAAPHPAAPRFSPDSSIPLPTPPRATAAPGPRMIEIPPARAADRTPEAPSTGMYRWQQRLQSVAGEVPIVAAPTTPPGGTTDARAAEYLKIMLDAVATAGMSERQIAILTSTFEVAARAMALEPAPDDPADSTRDAEADAPHSPVTPEPTPDPEAATTAEDADEPPARPKEAPDRETEAAPSAPQPPRPEDPEEVARLARERAIAELEERRARRQAAEAARRAAEEQARTEAEQRAIAAAEQRRQQEAEVRARAEADARAAAAEQRRRWEAEAERARLAREALATNETSATAESEPLSPGERTRAFARALREADTLCRSREGAFDAVATQFGKTYTSAYARALADARAIVAEGLALYADAQLNRRPLAEDSYLPRLSDAVDALRDQSSRFEQWRHRDSRVDDIVADLDDFRARAEAGLDQVTGVCALLSGDLDAQAEALAADAKRARQLLGEAADLFAKARDAEAAGTPTLPLTTRAERYILDALLVAHQVEDWGEYARAQRTRLAAADLETNLRYSTQAVVCYMAALDDFISLHRGRVSLAARAMLMLANQTLNRADAAGPHDGRRALRLVEQAEQQAAQGNRLALGGLNRN